MSNATILVIDDSPTILKVVQLVLTKAGYAVITASDGDKGVEAAKRHQPDLILLDFVMPNLNGYEVCRALRESDEVSETPVVLMSAKGEQVGDRFVKVMGIVDYITKPFSPEAIVAVVQHTLEKYAERSASVASADALIRELSPAEAIDAANEERDAWRESVASFRDALVRAAAQHVSENSELSPGAVSALLRDAYDDEFLTQTVGELRAVAPELAGGHGAGLTGDLKLVALAEVLLLLQQQEQSGILTVTRDAAQVDLHFRQGNIELATSAGVAEEFLLGRFILDHNLMSRDDLELFLKNRQGSSQLLGHQLVKLGYITSQDLKSAIRQQTCELVYELLRWNHGRFTFRQSSTLVAVAAEASLALEVDAILMEGFRRVDEWHLIEREIENFDLVFVRNEDALTRMGRGRLTREELTVLELVNGKNSVKDLVRHSRMGSFDVSNILYRLLSIKLVRRRVRPFAS